jgi:hypothetical protein
MKVVFEKFIQAHSSENAARKAIRENRNTLLLGFAVFLIPTWAFEKIYTTKIAGLEVLEDGIFRVSCAVSFHLASREISIKFPQTQLGCDELVWLEVVVPTGRVRHLCTQMVKDHLTETEKEREERRQ